MKKTFLVFLILGLILGSVYPLFPKTITLIHSNDTHGIYKSYKITVNGRERLVGGMEAASHYINKIRAMEKNILLIDTGDISTGTLASEIEYKGVAGGAMIEFLNRLGYDVWCYGNHDFDKGQDNALKLASLAKFPTVMANIIYKKNGKFFPAEPYHIFEMAGLKVGIIAIMEENFLMEVSKKSVEGLDVLPIIPTLNSYIPILDKETDLIVVLAHACFDEGIKIAQNVPGVDIVLVASEDGKFQEVNGVLVKSTLGHQKTLGYLRVEVEKDKVVSYEQKLIWLWADINLKASPQITALKKEVESLITPEYGLVIGEAKIDMTLNNYFTKIAPVENALGNWITDAMRWKTGAQVGLHNSGGIRSGIKAGPIAKADVFNVFPFHGTLVVFKLTGQQIKDALEYDVERNWDRLQVSGIKYRYYPKEAKPYGKRVDYVEINRKILVKKGKVLWPKKIYTIVSNNYLVEHAEDKYFGFPVVEPQNTGLLLNQVLMEWLETYKVLNYKLEGRIVRIID